MTDVALHGDGEGPLRSRASAGTPLTTPAADVAYDRLRSAFGRAAACHPDAVRVASRVFAGRATRVRTVGIQLGRLLDRSFAHLRLEGPSAAPELTIDLWEHAYYLDHQNQRPSSLKEVGPSV